MAGGVGGALVNKAEMAKTPPAVINGYIFLVSIIISFAGGMHGANTSNISGIMAMHDFKETFDFAQYSSESLANIRGWVTSVVVLGGMIGALTAAPFTDYLGRKWSLFLVAIVFNVGTALQVAADGNINQVIGARAMQGYSSGSGAVIGTLYLAEMAPKAIRGVLCAFFPMNVMIGIALGYWTNYIAILHISNGSHWQWRFPTLFQIYPGLMLLLLPLVPESPRWLALKGRNDEALSVLSRLRGLPGDHEYLLEEYGQIHDSVDTEVDAKASLSWLGLIRELRRDRTLLRRFILIQGIQIGFNFSGGNSITYYMTSILTTIGVASKSGNYLYSGIYGIIKIVAVLFFAFVGTERLGRRKMLLVGASVDIVCVTYVAIYLGKLTHNHNAGWAAVAMIYVFAFFYGSGWSPLAFGLNGEVFPNKYRAKIMSLSLGNQYLGNFLLTRFFPNMVDNIGSYGPFAIFAGVSTLMTVYLFFALPEPKGIAIEQMDQIFAKHWFLNGIRQPRVIVSRGRAEDVNELGKMPAEHLERKPGQV